MDVISMLKASYLSAAATIVLVYTIAPSRDRFIAYGARSASRNTGPNVVVDDSNRDEAPQTSFSLHEISSLNYFLDFLATFQVPHDWFMSFYLVSTTSSFIWLQQLSNHGSLYQMVAKYTQERAATMSGNQIALCWSIMAAQGARRLCECFSFGRPSKSKMWVLHWVVGIHFYVATGIAIWIEGVPALESGYFTPATVRLSRPSLRTIICLPVFLLASGIQNDVHRHLASLKKYTLPSHPAFATIICPHYTAECVIYAALVFLAAPQGHLTNNTMLCAMIFVVANLGVTADISKQWTMEKFGKDKVGNRWRMLPGIW